MSSLPALRNDELLTHVHVLRPFPRPLLRPRPPPTSTSPQPTSKPHVPIPSVEGCRLSGGVVASNVQTPVLFPSWEGCRPQAAGWSHPTSYPPKPPSSEGGAASAAGGATGVTRGGRPTGRKSRRGYWALATCGSRYEH
ncbi:MAG: hypothetical protein LBM98_00325 [Oscillospiraceae bacterium]|nr:hypothetical protein [Oscillospiraceae bacterium]